MQARCGLAHRPLFAPAVVPVYSGMVVEVPLHRAMSGGDAAQLRAALADHYAGSPIISVATGHDRPTLPIEMLKDRDSMTLFVFADEKGAQMRLTAVLDNLGKGASGAAVQTLNLMAGLGETSGLRL